MATDKTATKPAPAAPVKTDAAPATPMNLGNPVPVDTPPKKKRKSTAPKDESKADRFRRLANHRVPRALKILRAIGMLGNKAQYESTDEQIAKILQTIQDEYAAMKLRLCSQVSEEKSFKL